MLDCPARNCGRSLSDSSLLSYGAEAAFFTAVGAKVPGWTARCALRSSAGLHF